MTIIFASILAVVSGETQCQGQRKCVPFKQCWEYGSYIGKPVTNWPLQVRNEVRALSCGTENGTKEKIYKFCCKPMVIRNDDLIKPTGRSLLNLTTCGRQSSDRVAYGKIADVFEYPWMVLLGDINKDFHCGGSLIAESFVLTAAHCDRKRVSFVRVGETDLSTPIDCKSTSAADCAELYQDIPVARFIRHKRYSVSKKKNDIALIKLTKPAKLNHNVRPICLPLQEMLPRTLPRKMTVSGWGYIEGQNVTSNELRFAHLPTVDLEQCQQYIDQLHDVYTVDESQVCAGGGSDGADNCEGDSGGPLQYFGGKAFVIHGVVSWGLATCGKESAPGVYTKVSHYLSWIIDNLK